MSRLPSDLTSSSSSSPPSWNSSVLAHTIGGAYSYATVESSPFGGAFLADAPAYRSVAVSSHSSGGGFHPLEGEYQSRAVDLGHAAPAAHHMRNEWHHDYQQQSNYAAKSFDSFASAHKASPHDSYAAPAPHHLKELSLPRVEARVSHAAAAHAAHLPAMPMYVESSCFSLAHASVAPSQLWRSVQQQLQSAGVIVAEHSPFLLSCSATNGVSTCQFKVACFDGHYRDQEDNASRAGSSYTVEFQRRVGCCIGFMQFFRRVLSGIATQMPHVTIESRIAAEQPAPMPMPPAADEDVDSDLAGLDLSMLAMPTLARSNQAAPAPVMVADASLYESLLDLITSDDSASQITGMNSLALCLDGSHPDAPQLLQEVAAKLRHGQCEQVKQVAAQLLAQASATPSAASTVVAHCLPIVLTQLSSPAVSSPAAHLDASYASATQKSLLRSCVSLAGVDGFQTAFDGEGSIGQVASSRLKRELYRMTTSQDEEVCGLAKNAIRAISV